jgi:hypothetical protein
MRNILESLTRGLSFDVLATGKGEERGVPISYQAQSPVLGLVLPSNSPGVHALWMPIVPDADRTRAQARSAGAMDAVSNGLGVCGSRDSESRDIDAIPVAQMWAQPCSMRVRAASCSADSRPWIVTAATRGAGATARVSRRFSSATIRSIAGNSIST